jgi:hypothetical protein
MSGECGGVSVEKVTVKGKSEGKMPNSRYEFDAGLTEMM